MIAFAMLFAVWAATIALFFLFGSLALSVNGWIALGGLLLGEALLFARGIIRRAPKFGSGAAEMTSFLQLLHVAYFVAMILLALLALVLPTNVLIALHILCGLALLGGWAIAAKGRQHLEKFDQ